MNIDYAILSICSMVIVKETADSDEKINDNLYFHTKNALQNTFQS
jgi:hypothetical protein